MFLFVGLLQYLMQKCVNFYVVSFVLVFVFALNVIMVLI
jgi:hypothetical protein